MTIMNRSEAAAELLFVSVPFTGHIMSTVEIAKLIVERDHRVFITIFLINLPFDPNGVACAHNVVSSLTQPRIRFIQLSPKDTTTSTNTSFTEELFCATIEENKQPLRDDIANIITTESPRLAGFVIDVLCSTLKDVADEISVPSYFYHPSGAYFLDLALYILKLCEDRNDDDFCNIVNEGIALEVSSFSSPVPVGKIMPSLTNGTEPGSRFISHWNRFKTVKGILVNTFSELESQAMESLLKSGQGIPPIYPVGPIPNRAIGKQNCDVEDTVVAWLDNQPPSSVVFLCFGSVGCFDGDQVKEIACGIEKSGYRFLWSLRRPAENGIVNPDEYSDPREVLPDGFLKRTADIGKVIGWAPQVAVLSHAAVGGFVSHCGWNSVLESVWFGVPIATWPLYAEQQVNAFTLARELGLAAEITVEYHRDLSKGTTNFIVRGENIARGIRCVMEQESETRKKVKAMMTASRKAVEKHGSSYKWLGQFIEDVFTNMSSSY